ncbi:hypothetical protein Tco_1101030 [Tanacetum coccineum]
MFQSFQNLKKSSKESQTFETPTTQKVLKKSTSGKMQVCGKERNNKENADSYEGLRRNTNDSVTPYPFDYRVTLGFGSIAGGLDTVSPVIRLPIERRINSGTRIVLEALRSIKELADHSHKWHNEECKNTPPFSIIAEKLKALNHEMDELRVDVRKINTNDGMRSLHEEIKSIRTSEISYDRFSPKSNIHSPNLKDTFEHYLKESYERQDVLNEWMKKFMINTEMNFKDNDSSIKRLEENINHLIEEVSMVKLNAICYVVLQNELPPKEKDPGSFILPCAIGTTTLSNALADLGASISIMPFFLV